MRILLLTILFMAIPGSILAAGVKEISPQQVYSMMKEGSGLWLIDVRGERIFGFAHIEGAVNIPRAVLAHKSFPPQKMLVLVDNSPGEREARQAAEGLARSGHEQVYVLTGGIAAWRRADQGMVGERGAWELVRLMPDDLRWATERNIPLRIIDLRREQERERGPLPVDGEVVAGEDLDEKVVKAADLLRPSSEPGLAGELEAKPLPVIIFPAGADARLLYQVHLWALPEDVRVVEGGYLTGAARGERKTSSSGEMCRSCSGN